MDSYFSIKNWDTFQQYKDRDPKWIKLHREILNDYEFDQLTEIQQNHLMKIWLLASKLDNKIPNDPSWIGRQIGAKSKVDTKQLVTHGFIVMYGSVQECTQTYLETETETETEKKLHWSNDFDRWWKSYPKKVGKKTARSIWQRIKPEADTLIADTMLKQQNDSQWLGGYIPNPTTYLNQERWNDELQTRNGSGSGTLSPSEEYEQRVQRENETISKLNGCHVADDGKTIPPPMDKKQRRDRQPGVPRLDS